MSQLSQLLIRAFENKSGRNSYYSGSWNVAFGDRTYETLFYVYFNRVEVLSGTTWDKSVSLSTSEDFYPHDKLIRAVKLGLPEYHFTGEVYERYMKQRNSVPEATDNYT